MDKHYDEFDEDDVEIVEQSTSMKKDLIIESSEQPSCHLHVEIPYNASTRELDLGKVLHDLFLPTTPSPVALPPHHRYQIFYYSPDTGYFLFGGMYPFQQLLLLGEEFIPASYIFVKLNRVWPPPQAPPLEDKKKRKNDRTIKQVLEKVAEWRKIQEQQNITLEQAAKMINMAKKTLDDYFYQIKMAQEFGFEFEENLHHKIGVLRKFVRENKKKNENKQGVKILQQFMKNSEEASDEELYMDEDENEE